MLKQICALVSTDLVGPPVSLSWPSHCLDWFPAALWTDLQALKKMDRVTEEADGLFILFHLEMAEGSNRIAGRHKVKPVVHLLQKPCSSEVGLRSCFTMYLRVAIVALLKTCIAELTFIFSK